ncbi:hypothetical protein JCM11251_004231 [Rhodosporidiobolus azoricus]
MSFHPPLATTTFIPLPSSSTPTAPSAATVQPTTFCFTYLPSASSPLPDDAVPQVWTNLPKGDGQWHALPLVSSSSASSDTSKKLYTASVDLSSITSPTDFEYTYRLSFPSGEEKWLGSAGGNGRISVVSAAPPHTTYPGLIASALEQGTGPGEWEELSEGIAVGRFRWGEGRDGGEVETFDISTIVETLGEADGAWKEGDGVVWEQSSRSWLVPRPLPAGSPLSSLSSAHPAQLLILRSASTASHPVPRSLVLFPFSTREVCSTLIGSTGKEGQGKLLLQCERDAPPANPGEKGEGHLAVAWGHEGAPSLPELIGRAVSAARSVLLKEPYEAPSQQDFHGASIPKPLPLGLCTWNALSQGGAEDYTLSDVLAWLDGLNLAGISALNRSDLSASSFPSAAVLSPAHGAAKSLLLDDGWQDTASYTDLSESLAADEDDAEKAQRAERRALKSFGVKRGWYDLATAAPSVAASVVPSRSSTPTPGSKPSHRARTDSGYGRSPALSLASVPPEELDAAREGVSAELCDAIRRIKERGVERVGVWMTLLGYWHGIHPDSALADAYTLRLTTLRSAIDPSYSLQIYLPCPSDLPIFYRDYFSSLHAAGVDFVKVDDQASIDAIVEQEGGENDDGEEEWKVEPGELKHLILESMRKAVAEVFGKQGAGTSGSADVNEQPYPALINCMAGSPRIWGGSLGVVGNPVSTASDKSSSSAPSTTAYAPTLMRTSDDFFPSVPDSHRWHLYHNALTSLLTSSPSALRFAPCFDMCQAKNAWGRGHLALRAFSSAPVWSTDAPFEESGENEEPNEVQGEEGAWASLVATTKNGAKVVQARSATGSVLESSLTVDAVGRDEQDGESKGVPQPLKVGLPLPHAKGAHLGLWNCLAEGKGAIEAVVDAKDVGDAFGSALDGRHGQDVVVFSATAGFVEEYSASSLLSARSAPRTLAQPLKNVVDLAHPGSVEVLTVAQVFSLGTVKVACLGLVDKTVGLAAIRSIKLIKLIGGSGTSTPERQEERATSSLSPDATAGSQIATAPTLSSSSSSPDMVAPTSNVVSSALQPRPTSPRPVPQARLPFLLAYLTGFLRLPLGPSAGAQQQQNQTAQRTPSTELRSLLDDLFRRPLRTVWHEVGAVVSFGFAAVVWALGVRGRTGGAGRSLEGLSTQAQVEEEEEQDGKDRLEVLLDFVSPRVGFYVSSLGVPSSTGIASALRFKLDGKEVEEKYVYRAMGAEGKVVEVDAEGAWRGQGGKEVKGGGETKPWRLTVSVA